MNKLLDALIQELLPNLITEISSNLNFKIEQVEPPKERNSDGKAGQFAIGAGNFYFYVPGNPGYWMNLVVSSGWEFIEGEEVSRPVEPEKPVISKLPSPVVDDASFNAKTGKFRFVISPNTLDSIIIEFVRRNGNITETISLEAARERQVVSEIKGNKGDSFILRTRQGEKLSDFVEVSKINY